MGRDPFNQNFRKFRSKTQWIGSVQPEKFRKNGSTFWGGPLFPVGPVGILVERIAPMASTRFVPPETILEALIEEQANTRWVKPKEMFLYSKNLLEWKEKTKKSKTLKRESSTKDCAHSFRRWKKKGRRRIWTSNITVVCIQDWPLFTEGGLPHSHHRRTGI